MFAACEKSEESSVENEHKDDGGSYDTEIDYEKGYDYLSSLNVSDAKMIYKKDAAKTRSGESDGGYWKLDLNGNESKLIITGEDGTESNIDIVTIVKLNNSLLYVVPNTNQIIDLISTPEPDTELKPEPEPETDADADVDVNVKPDVKPDYDGALYEKDDNTYAILVDIRTEKMYKCPSEIKDLLRWSYNTKYMSDGNDNVYIGNNDKIYKVDISNFAVSSMLPEGVTFRDFDVTSDGYIMYGDDGYERAYKVKCPTGRIVPIDGQAFILGNDIYSCKDKKIFKWNKEDNNLIVSEVCTVAAESWDPFSIYDILKNPANNNIMLLGGHWSFCYVFNGANCTKIEISDSFFMKVLNSVYISTSKAWYVKESSGFSKVAMSNYKETKIEISDCDITKYSASAESPNITVSGYQYSDGSYFIGYINENDELIVDETFTNSNTIVELIPIN